MRSGSVAPGIAHPNGLSSDLHDSCCVDWLQRGLVVSEASSWIAPIRRLKVADAIAAQLSELITAGNFKPNDKLPPERVLSEQFGVGRSSMREALRSLEADGLVRSEHGIGIFVVDPTKKRIDHSELLVAGDYTVAELFEVRLPLEREAAGLAALRITQDEIDHLQGIIQDMSVPELSDAQFIELDAQLHRTIAEATKNALLVSVIRTMEPHFFSYSKSVMTLPARREHAHRGHVRIVEAVAAHDVRDARAAAVRHIRDVERDIRAYIDQAPIDGAARPR